MRNHTVKVILTINCIYTSLLKNIQKKLFLVKILDNGGKFCLKVVVKTKGWKILEKILM
jgi:hypothetical protein